MAKSKPPKRSSKAVKKAAQKTHRKQLEASITDKFLEAVKSLGHDAEVIGKEIRKAGKLVAKKAAEKFKDIKEAVEHKFDSGVHEVSKEKIKRAVKAVQQAETRAEKAAKQAVSGAKRTVKRAVAQLDQAESAAKNTVSRASKTVKTTATKATSTVRRRSPAKKPVGTLITEAPVAPIVPGES